ATVTEEARMVMTWKGQTIANLSREFLNTNGADKHAVAEVTAKDLSVFSKALYTDLRQMAADLKTSSRRGLVERFDGSIGAGSVLMPFGGKTQRTPAQSMAALLPVLPGQTTDSASVMAWGLDADVMSVDPYSGARAAVYNSVAKIVAAGADYKDAYLTLQEFFERLRTEPARWGKPFAALLGAMDAQLELNAAAIGGKDSMSGTFLDKDVPPTLISFAIAPIKAGDVISPEFKEAGNPVYLFAPKDETPEATKTAWDCFHTLCEAGKVKSAWAVENGLAEAVMKMSFGNEIGFKSNGAVTEWYGAMMYDFIVAELSEPLGCDCGLLIGNTTEEAVIDLGTEAVSIKELLALNEGVLEGVYPTKAPAESKLETFAYEGGMIASPAIKCARPKVLIPVFPGTNCEYDSAKVMEAAGAEADIVVIRNLTADDVARSVEIVSKKLSESQMVFLPGGFSGGDEPDGSAKFITAFFRNPAVKEQVGKLLDERDGLMLGICNGFQALIKLGLVPYGKIIDTDENCPTLTYNTIGRHQSMLVRTRVCTNKSPWLTNTKVGEIYTVPISHGEG
ncbi:MAG: phosphoribosylformylglycinamidine synthase subunit PurQ, partial [Clostridia bacterium]|nr:phosphoribosylformylglycinamidine synthase subunit PurQ [Clostridia bacterium]